MADWPLYCKDDLKVGNLQSEVGIATLWTPKEKILKIIPSEKFAVVGQLYSTSEGISLLLRNCLANKKIRHIIVVGSDLTESGEALIQLSKQGLNDNHEIIGSDHIQLHKEIPRRAVELFRQSVRVHDYRQLREYQELNRVIDQLPQFGSYGDPEVFREPKIEPPESFPSAPTGFFIRQRLIADAWLNALWQVLRFGINSEVECKSRRELLDQIMVIEAEAESPSWREFFPFSREQLKNYVDLFFNTGAYADVSSYGRRLHELYGIDQLKAITRLLKSELKTRRAVALAWYPKEDLEQKAPSTLISIQTTVLQKDGSPHLFLKADFREQDIFNEWPLDAYALRTLQFRLSRELGIEPGTLTIVTGCSYTALHDVARATKVVQENPRRLVRVGDPRGNLLIALRGGKIEVTQQDPNGKTIDRFYGQTAKELYTKIALEERVSSLAHAADIGAELQKAEIALAHGLRYQQDQELSL